MLIYKEKRLEVKKMSENKTSAAQLTASREYEKTNDRINIVFPAGTRSRMKALGIEKPNTFIKEVVASELEKMEKYSK